MFLPFHFLLVTFRSLGPLCFEKTKAEPRPKAPALPLPPKAKREVFGFKKWRFYFRYKQVDTYIYIFIDIHLNAHVLYTLHYVKCSLLGVNFIWILGEYDKVDVQGWQYTYCGNPYSSTSVVKSTGILFL